MSKNWFAKKNLIDGEIDCRIINWQVCIYFLTAHISKKCFKMMLARWRYRPIRIGKDLLFGNSPKLNTFVYGACRFLKWFTIAFSIITWILTISSSSSHFFTITFFERTWRPLRPFKPFWILSWAFKLGLSRDLLRRRNQRAHFEHQFESLPLSLYHI